MQTIERVTATKIVIKVDGFQDAKDWMYRLIRAGVATCSSCDKPANHIWWNDAAEGYFECDDHYNPAPMWCGSTLWDPAVFDKRVFPDLAREWVATLPPDEQHRIQFREYDATDWYAWLTADHWKTYQEIALTGDLERGTVCRLYSLKNGQLAYEIIDRSPTFAYHYGLIAPFDSVEAAVEAARKAAGL